MILLILAVLYFGLGKGVGDWEGVLFFNYIFVFE